MTALGPDANLAKELEEFARICEAEGAKLTATMLTQASNRIERLEFVLHSLHMYAKSAVESHETGAPLHPTLKPMLETTVEILRGHN